MASSPPGSPASVPARPMSAMIRPARSQSRMSLSSKVGGGSRASDEDGKTSVKVAIRVRPPLRPQDPGYELIPQRFQKSMVTVTGPTSVAIDSAQGRKLFVFDRVFGEEVDQSGVWEYLTESVDAFVQGYNVSMMAYGQSGAGKSYTMGTSGPEDQADLEVMGVIPRAAQALFEKLAGPKEPSKRDSMSGMRAPKRYSVQPSHLGKQFEKTWSLKATYVEIYNEHLRDLLVPEHVPQHERGQVAIREDTKGHILLTGLHSVEINSVDDLLAALNFGSTIRQTDSTAINAKSSRSHAVFTLNLVQRKTSSQATPKAEKRFSVPLEAMTGSETMVTIDSKFHFVDLAGSERLKNTGAQGDRAKEGISINAGLASLGKVISQLSSRQAGSHVSYRDSKLTRMLQDSLGGNAITYMIACVTPAEFHLSETLNTVQYAQRARAIQSKPRIQQVSDESDKQALIDRLKAEVAFLRDQIRSSERGDGAVTNGAAGDRTSRVNEAAIELQNQLLDSQESYTALSQRHAKLISEMTKARDSEIAENKLHEEREGDYTADRLKRSNNFAEAVEQVVLEYEETIRSLEHSLSSTRATLSNTETTLLERESKCAYIETVNSQLQVRIQKLMDRESSTENYLQDLEIKLDGHTSGEEKNSSIINELRKEIARLRENEASCEDYISTLEERLAEADNDQDALKREVERLELVVERQRGLGNLDKLLHDLDNGPNGESRVDPIRGRAISINSDRNPHSRNDSYANLRERGDVIHEGDEVSVIGRLNGANDDPSVRSNSTTRSEFEGPIDNGEPIEDDAVTPHANAVVQDPVEVKMANVKLEMVSKELLDLRFEHEKLAAKYEEALRALESRDESLSRHDETNRDSFISTTSHVVTRPQPFLSHARMNEENRNGGQYSSSRSLSSELSLAGESPSLTQSSDAETAIVKKSDSSEVSGETQDETIAAEVEELRKLAEEKEASEALLAQRYAQLEEKHTETVNLVEELKTQVHRAKMAESNPSRHSLPALRRKSSQGIMVIDRAHRSFASLRNIATEQFENNPDVMQNFELNLNSAMHELHTRSERVQQLEAEIAATKKEMEMKMTIISGLTRERASISQSPMDMSAMSAMRDQLLQSENQIRILQETHRAREEELGAQLGTLRAAVAAHSKEVQAVSERTIADQGDAKEAHESKIAELEAELAETKARDGKIATLEAELAGWETRHQTALESMQASEKQLLSTIAALENRIAIIKAESEAEEQLNKSVAPSDKDRSISETDFEQYSTKHEALVATLQHEVDEHKSVVAANAKRIAELEASHKMTISQLEEALDGMVNENATKVAELTAAKSQLEQAQKAAEAKSHARISELEETQAVLKAELDTIIRAKESCESEIESHKAYAHTLEQQIGEMEEGAKAQAAVAAELEANKALVAKLQQQVEEHKIVVKTHEDGLKLLHANHARAIEDVKTAASEAKRTAMTDMVEHHQRRLDAAYAELAESRNELASVISQVDMAFGEQTVIMNIHERVEELVTSQQALIEEQKKNADLQESLTNEQIKIIAVGRKLQSAEKQLAEVLPLVDSDAKNSLAAAEARATELEQELQVVKVELAELLDSTSAGAKLKEENASLTEQLAVVKLEMKELSEKNKKNSGIVEELEIELTKIYDDRQEETKRLSTLQSERNSQIDMANQARTKVENELEAVREKYAGLQAQLEQLTMGNNVAGVRTSEFSGRFNTKTASVQSFASPPPSAPPSMSLPPIPNGVNVVPPTPTSNGISVTSPRNSHSTHASKDISLSPTNRDSVSSNTSFATAQAQQLADQDAKIRTIEKHLNAEKQLTVTLEEALTDLERQNKKTKMDAEQWRRRAVEAEEGKKRMMDQSRMMEQQLTEARAREIERNKAEEKAREEAEKATRWSLQRVEEEKRKRSEAERVTAQLEQRMGNVKAKKKKGSLNCF